MHEPAPTLPLSRVLHRDADRDASAADVWVSFPEVDTDAVGRSATSPDGSPAMTTERPAHARAREARTCECGCGRSLEGRRKNTRYALRECREFVAQKRRELALQATLARKQRKLDLRIAYGRIVTRYGESEARSLLTERQRAALDRREVRT